MKVGFLSIAFGLCLFQSTYPMSKQTVDTKQALDTIESVLIEINTYRSAKSFMPKLNAMKSTFNKLKTIFNDSTNKGLEDFMTSLLETDLKKWGALKNEIDSQVSCAMMSCCSIQ